MQQAINWTNRDQKWETIGNRVNEQKKARITCKVILWQKLAMAKGIIKIILLTLVIIAISFYTAFSLCIQFLLQEEIGRLLLLERALIHEKNLRKIRIKTFSTTHDGLWWRVLCARRGAWKYTFSYQMLLGVWKWTLGGWKYKYSHQKSRAWEWLWTRGDWRCSFWYQKSQPWE